MLVPVLIVSLIACGLICSYASFRVGVSVGTERAYKAVREMLYGGRGADPMKIEKRLLQLMRESAE